jgi:hypothetical protein
MSTQGLWVKGGNKVRYIFYLYLEVMINISRLQLNNVFFGNGKDLCVLLELIYMKA